MKVIAIKWDYLRLTIPEFAPTEAPDQKFSVESHQDRLTIPEFAPTEAHPCRQPYFPPRFAAVGERQGIAAFQMSMSAG